MHWIVWSPIGLLETIRPIVLRWLTFPTEKLWGADRQLPTAAPMPLTPQLNDYLLCPICFNQFSTTRKPFTLVCSHTCCSNCLQVSHCSLLALIMILIVQAVGPELSIWFDTNSKQTSWEWGDPWINCHQWAEYTAKCFARIATQLSDQWPDD